MKHLLLPALVSCLLMLNAAAGDAVDPLEKQVACSYSYKSFDDAVGQIEQKTGFKVSCPKEVSELMQTIFMGMGMGTGAENSPKVKAKDFLDSICSSIGLAWKYDKATNVVSLDLYWKKDDPRSVPELFHYLSDHQGNSAEWQAAFDALLSKSQNYEKAWKVRQKSCFQNVFMPFAPATPKVILFKPVVAVSLEKYKLLMLCQPIQMYPGHGSVSYYWFKDDGTLLGADLMNTGHRCALVDATIDNEYGAYSDRASELQMIVKMNTRDFSVATFALDANGLKLTRFADIHGAEKENSQGVGASLMVPDKQ